MESIGTLAVQSSKWVAHQLGPEKACASLQGCGFVAIVLVWHTMYALLSLFESEKACYPNYKTSIRAPGKQQCLRKSPRHTLLQSPSPHLWCTAPPPPSCGNLKPNGKIVNSVGGPATTHKGLRYPLFVDPGTVARYWACGAQGFKNS